MARRRKLEKFADLLSFPNVFECVDIGSPQLRKTAFEHIILKGKWADQVFGNANPICLEIACGRGEYALALAKMNPSVNYIGVDIKGARIWQGAKRALREGIKNLAFLRTRIEWLESYFSRGEVNEIWITFPDPFPAKENRRLTAPMFLSIYRKIMDGKGIVHLKTDDEELYEYSLATIKHLPFSELLEKDDNIYAGSEINPLLSIQTHYEKRHLQEGKQIKYLRFTWKVE